MKGQTWDEYTRYCAGDVNSVVTTEAPRDLSVILSFPEGWKRRGNVWQPRRHLKLRGFRLYPPNSETPNNKGTRTLWRLFAVDGPNKRWTLTGQGHSPHALLVAHILTRN